MKVKKLTCRFVVRYAEFPEMLFGKQPEEQISYFNATQYIQKKGDPKRHNISEFQKDYVHWIDAAKQLYEIENQDIFFFNEAGDILIDESLALPFLAYIQPEFGIYLLERMSEMLLNGFVMSDNCLLQTVKQRFSDEELISNSEAI